MDPDSRRLRVTVTDGRGRAVAAPGLAAWLARVAPVRARGEIGVALVSDARIQSLNKRYRRRNRATDVLSFEPSDIVIATGDLRTLPRALRLGRATLTAIRQNLFWAFAYNALGIPLAALGFFGRFGPMIAALAMSLSSITVVARSSVLARLDLDR